eukprot:GHVU01105765.1.p1 GENE.GHVU01105765.1~~GHVU01105765.1.p1  ORF type:complete len:151 (-),score=1.58 GHVU01105765.1:387-839(-)
MGIKGSNVAPGVVAIDSIHDLIIIIIVMAIKDRLTHRRIASGNFVRSFDNSSIICAWNDRGSAHSAASCSFCTYSQVSSVMRQDLWTAYHALSQEQVNDASHVSTDGEMKFLFQRLERISHCRNDTRQITVAVRFQHPFTRLHNFPSNRF